MPCPHFREVRRQGREAGNLPPPCAECKNAWNHISTTYTPPYAKSEETRLAVQEPPGNRIFLQRKTPTLMATVQKEPTSFCSAPCCLTLRRLMSYIYMEHPFLMFLDHTTTQHSRQDSSERVNSSSQRPLPDNTRHSQQTNIHAPGGIRTHDFSR